MLHCCKFTAVRGTTMLQFWLVLFPKEGGKRKPGGSWAQTRPSWRSALMTAEVFASALISQAETRPHLYSLKAVG